MSGGLVRFLAGLPVIGYLLKVAHDFVMLPRLRADLHQESADLASRVFRQEVQVNDHASRLRVLSDGLAALTESVARLRQSQVHHQETALAGFSDQTRQTQASNLALQQALAFQQTQVERQQTQADLLRAQSDRQEAILAAVSERLAPLEAHTATSREQLETVLQRLSDNLAEWVELRQRLQALQGEASAQCRDIEGLQAKTEERTSHDQMVVIRLDDASAKVQELQSQMNTQEDAFAGVLRQHTRTLAELRDAIVSRKGDPHRNGGDMAQLLDSFRDLLGGRRVADPPAIEEVPELPRRFQPAVRLLLGETVPGGRFGFRVASAPGREADLVADFSELPFAPAAVAEIRAGDLLDRCAPKEGRRLLAHWSQLLWAGGVLHLTFTDLEAAERTYAHVSSAFGELSRAILSQRGERQKAFNRETVHRLLGEAGFRDIVEQPCKDLSQGFRIEIQATKSDGMSA